MLSSLIENSKSKLVFSENSSEYTVKDLLSKGSDIDTIKAGNWKICKARNDVNSISSILYNLAESNNIAVISDATPDDTTQELIKKLENEQVTYQGIYGLGLLTSGTSGIPKIVVHDQTRIYRKCRINESEIYSRFGFSNILCALQLSFGHGLIGNFLSALSTADKIVITNSDLKGLSSAGELIKKHGINFLSSVPSMWKILKHAIKGKNNHLNIGIGSAYLPRNLSEHLLKNTCNDLINFYGLTEMSNWIGFNKANQNINELYDSKGNAKFKMYDDVEYEIEQIEDDYGELCLKHETMLVGYHGHRYPTTKHGHYRTSDIFSTSQDELGRLTMIGRDKFYVKRASIFAFISSKHRLPKLPS